MVVQQKPQTGNKNLRPLLTVHGSWPKMIGRNDMDDEQKEDLIYWLIVGAFIFLTAKALLNVGELV